MFNKLKDYMQYLSLSNCTMNEDQRFKGYSKYHFLSSDKINEFILIHKK